MRRPNPLIPDRDGRLASSALSQLTRCEIQLLLQIKHGQRTTAYQEKRAQEGNAVHDHIHHREVEKQEARDERCFIATAALGIHDPDTDRLRSFRDRVLLASRPGTWFVHFYYAVSPMLCRVMGPAAHLIAPALRWLARRVEP